MSILRRRALSEKQMIIADSVVERRAGIVSQLTRYGFKRLEEVSSFKALSTAFERKSHSQRPQIELIIASSDLLKDESIELLNAIIDRFYNRRVPMMLFQGSESAAAAAPSPDLVVDVLETPAIEHGLCERVELVLALTHEYCAREAKERELKEELAEHRLAELHLQHLVGHDDLTGLANRRSLDQALQFSILWTRATEKASALLYLDLDEINVIYEVEGRTAGDKLLVEASRALRKAYSHGMLARLSSDVFALLVDDTTERETFEIAECLREAFARHSFKCGENNYHIGISIGVAMVFEGSVVDPGDVLTQASQACHMAKLSGGGKTRRFSHQDRELAQLRRESRLVPHIRQALHKDNFFFEYQPVLDVKRQCVSHFELLLRLRDERGNVISPDDFIPVAEKVGLIHQIDRWVVDHAIDLLAALPPDQNHLSLNINLSSRAFDNQEIFDLIKSKLEMQAINPARLTFEITETSAIRNLSRARRIISQHRSLGCSFSLDDFGSGFSSFNYLKTFPVDYLKLDGSFIHNLVSDPTDQKLVEGMIEIAHSLGKLIVAEYVKDEETYALLKNMGIDYIQGQYISGPVPTLFGQFAHHCQ